MTSREERLLSAYTDTSARIQAALMRVLPHAVDATEYPLVIEDIITELETAVSLIKRARQDLLHAPNGQYCVACTIDRYLEGVERKTPPTGVDMPGNIAL